jgi:signal transduction histidine kinase
MKLINITTRYYISLFLVVIALWSVAFYFIMKYEVYQSIDEVLYNRATNISKYVEQHREHSGNDPLSDYHIKQLTKAQFEISPSEIYADTLVYEPTDNEYDEYRKLEATFHQNDLYFSITVVKPRLESTEIFNTILLNLIPLSMVTVLVLVVGARQLNKNLWKPFYQVVNFLSGYRVDKDSPLPETATSVVEFKALVDSLQTLIQRNAQVFQQQKQFIENASHETQTPLAVIQSQMEILLQMPGLTNEQAEIIQSTLKETDRLTKLNKTLLLLSKIENEQFIDKSTVNLETLTRKLLAYFEDKKEKLALTVTIESESNCVVATNPVLAEVLIGNLVKNAFTHNVEGGRVTIRLSSGFFEIGNTGLPIPDTQRLFERFYNPGANPESWGLGLSIVRKIVDINGWSIKYEFSDHTHKFRIDFLHPQY